MLYGELTYDNQNYRFTLDDFELSIHCVDVPLGSIPLAFFTSERPPVDEILIGTCYPDGQRIAIYVNGYWSSHNNVLSQKARWYFRFTRNITRISAISIEADELNEIFPIGRAIHEQVIKENPVECGVVVKPFNSDIYCFHHEGQKIECKYTMYWTTTKRNVSTPIRINTHLSLQFSPTEDYLFCSSLVNIAKKYIEYLCYRQNIAISSVNLLTLDDAERYRECGVFYAPWLAPDQEEQESIIKKKYIPEAFIGSSNAVLLQSISEGNIYLRHIPRNSKDGRIITPAQFVMVTAAFEWEYRKLFPQGVPHKSRTLKAREEAAKLIDEAAKDMENSRVKQILERVKETIGFDNLESKIVYACRELDDCIRPFGDRLFKLNKCIYHPETIGRELSAQRNNFAHGNLDKEFSLIAALSLNFLEDMIYAMQLTGLGIPKENITKAINHLKGCPLALDFTAD